MYRRAVVLVVLVITVLVATACQGADAGGGSSVKKTYSSPPAMTVDTNKQYTATIETSMGTMTAELYVKDAPKTVNNFVFLTNEGYYNGVKFHRIIKGFMVQTGDPTGTGAGGPGYKFEDEKNARNYERGTLAMANSGPNTNGSQFFICQGAQCSSLPKNYTIFGKLTGGLDVLDKIAGVSVKAGASGEVSSPTSDITMKKVTIQVK